MIFICKHCGIEFKRDRERFYCSHVCWGLAHKGLKRSEYIKNRKIFKRGKWKTICKVCGKIFISTNSQRKWNTQIYCSSYCHGNRYQHVCVLCGKEFWGQRKQKFCSYACSSRSNKRPMFKLYADLGIKMRSSWEANILRIFNYLGFHVDYEKFVFSLSNGTSYIPDFYINDTDEFVEVKGGWWNAKSKEKFDLFKEEYPGISIELIGPSKYWEYVKEFPKICKKLENKNATC